MENTELTALVSEMRQNSRFRHITKTVSLQILQERVNVQSGA